MKYKDSEEIYFTPRQAAEHFNLSLSTIKNYIYANKLKTLITPGGHHRICKHDLLNIMEKDDFSTGKLKDVNFLMEFYCSALVKVFKLFGSQGDSFIIHARSVSNASYDLSKALGLTEQEAFCIKMAALVHDIGHLGLDRHILLKTSPFTCQEYESVKIHPATGERLLKSIEELKDISEIVSQHHERVDGKGYPKGITAADIQRGASIIAISEAYDSMISTYSYKKPISRDMAVAELMKYRGTQFDGDIVEIFIHSLPKITTF